MKVVVAPNAFKGCLAAADAAGAMAEGVARAAPDAGIARVPVADGGDGLVDVALAALGGEVREAWVSGPRERALRARFCHVPALRLAAIEMALASGLALRVEDERDPTRTTTRGTGEMIAAALDLGVTRIAVGIGGSATNDGGIGMATALGVRFLDDRGDAVEPVGGALGRIRRIDASSRDRRLEGVQIEAVCDVDNPLLGPRGATRVYGPQKGATAEQVEALEAGLANLAAVVAADLGIDVRTLPGGGAAGGLGAGLRAFLGARLRRGVDVVLDLVDLDRHLDGADLVLTGEGRIDGQTLFGKAPAGVAARARARGIPCLAIAGGVGDDLGDLHAIGIDAVFSLCREPLTLERAITEGRRLLAAATEQAVRAFLAGRGGVGSGR
ncbi:MAG: glycerate kinase [Rhodospirillales bacterium]